MYGAFFIIMILICLIPGLITLIGIWKMFEKAGQPGWGCLIPIYNLYLMTKVAQKPGWWVVMYFIPGVNLIFLIMLYHHISINFGKGAGFTIGLLLLGFIFFPILGFGSAEYKNETV